MTRRAAIYARCNTADQRPEVQLDPLGEYAEARGFEIAAEYVDHGISGTKASRPALDEMMAAARRRNLDVIVIVKLDRLAPARWRGRPLPRGPPSRRGCPRICRRSWRRCG